MTARVRLMKCQQQDETCSQPVATHRVMWQSSAMAAPAFWYECARHAAQALMSLERAGNRVTIEKVSA